MNDLSLFLRPWTADDAPTLATLAGDPTIADSMISIPEALGHDGAARLIDAYAREERAGTARHRAVVLPGAGGDGAIVGGVGLRDIDATHRQAELSFWIGRPWWGRGAARRAAALALVEAFGTLRLNRVEAFHMAHNDASARVLLALGFRLEGRLRERVWKGGRPVDVLAYALLCADALEAGASTTRVGMGDGRTREGG